MQENWLSADVVIFLDFNSTIRLLTANFLPRSVDNYKSVNETGYGRSWDWKQGWVVIWLWVIFSELGHGRSGDRKRGGHQAGTKIFITSLFWTYCVPDLCELPSLRKKMHHNANTSFPTCWVRKLPEQVDLLFDPANCNLNPTPTPILCKWTMLIIISFSQLSK